MIETQFGCCGVIGNLYNCFDVWLVNSSAGQPIIRVGAFCSQEAWIWNKGPPAQAICTVDS
jgi:hypothetical protein